MLQVSKVYDNTTKYTIEVFVPFEDSKIPRELFNTVGPSDDGIWYEVNTFEPSLDELALDELKVIMKAENIHNEYGLTTRVTKLQAVRSQVAIIS